MAGVEREQQKKESGIERAAWWIAEKSMYITVPLAVFAIAAGAVAVGIASLAIDGVEYWAIKNHKKKKEPKAMPQTLTQSNSDENVIFLSDVLRKRQAPMLKAT